jgi:hypothetical protein
MVTGPLKPRGFDPGTSTVSSLYGVCGRVSPPELQQSQRRQPYRHHIL